MVALAFWKSRKTKNSSPRRAKARLGFESLEIRRLLSLTCTPCPSMCISETPNAAMVSSADPIGFSITISNKGPGAACNVKLCDSLPAPAGVTWQSVTTTAGYPAASLYGNSITDCLGTLSAGACVTFHVAGTTAPGFGGTLSNTATASSTNTCPGSVCASASIVVQAPNLCITKTDDASTIVAGQTAGYTVKITNRGAGAAEMVALADALPAGTGNDIKWQVDASGTGLGAGTNPADFQVSGSVGSQSLALSSAFIVGLGDRLAAGQTISVHVTGVTTANDTGGSALSALGPAANYTVLYEGTGGHNLQVTNVAINGNVGVGGTGKVQFSGPGTIAGRLDFSSANTGQFSNNNRSNVGPTSVNYGTAQVTSALNAVNSLNSSLAGLGNSIAINGTQTINESAGLLKTVNGVAYRIFNVTSYGENDGKLLTINGDGSGDAVVFNFGLNSNVNLGGDVALAGGLSADQVLWNFTTSGKNISLNNNASSYRTLAFDGTILAPNDAISVTNSNLIGRVFGGNNSDMQIVSGDTITAPAAMPATLTNTATVTSCNNCPTSISATAPAITIDPAAR